MSKAKGRALIMIRIVSVIIALAASLSGFTQVGTKPKTDRPQLMNFAPADDASRDDATGLPTRIVHKASGVVFVLIPAGEFQMGSPADEADRSSIGASTPAHYQKAFLSRRNRSDRRAVSPVRAGVPV